MAINDATPTRFATTDQSAGHPQHHAEGAMASFVRSMNDAQAQAIGSRSQFGVDAGRELAAKQVTHLDTSQDELYKSVHQAA